MRRSLIAVFLLPIIITPETAQATITAEWEVENRFRLFAKTSDFRLHLDAYNSLAPLNKKSPILSIERKLNGPGGPKHGWASKVFFRTCWNRKERTYTGCTHYIRPKSHNILLRLTGSEDIESNDICIWKVLDKTYRRNCLAPKYSIPLPYPENVTVSFKVEGKPQTGTLENVQVRDVLIAGLGDSFSSGEGNPDQPVQMDNIKCDSSSQTYTIDGCRPKSKTGAPARWWDRNCHRSLYSQHIRAGLQLAIENPKIAVTYIGFPCSGAEVDEGILGPWDGVEKTSKNFRGKNAISRQGKYLNEPQITSVVRELCRQGNIVPSDDGLMKCDREFDRKIDAVFLSIGGNDIGFSKVIANVIIMGGNLNPVRRVAKRLNRIISLDKMKENISKLEEKYKRLSKSINDILGVRNNKVSITSYPDIHRADYVYNPYPDICYKTNNGESGMTYYHKTLHINGETLYDTHAALSGFHTEMKKIADDIGWQIAINHRSRFREHGFCTQKPKRGQISIAEEFALPLQKSQRIRVRYRSWKNRNVWEPYSPDKYRHYAPRQRWFRTVNDVVMGINLHNPDAGFEKKLLDRLRGGAFHPSAEAHSVIAEELRCKAAGILDLTPCP